MAIVSTGYDGTVNEVQWAGLAPTLGALEQVVSGFDSTVLTSPDRGLSLSAGVGAGHGVRDVSDSSVVVTCNSTTGSRWDTVVLRRDWAANTTSVVVVSGQTTKRISSGLNANPGVLDDQPLFLARVQSGSSVITELQDVRVRASAALTVPDLLGLPSAPDGAIAYVGSKLWRRSRDTGGSLAWFDHSATVETPIVVNAANGWKDFSAGYAPRYVVSSSGWVSLNGVVGRSTTLTLGLRGFADVWNGMPAEIRPRAPMFFPAVSFDGEVDLTVSKTAPLRLRNRGSARSFSSLWWVGLDGIGWQL